MIPRLIRRIDPIKTALGVFVVLGLALTGVAGYALVATISTSESLSPGAAVALLSSLSLVAFLLVAPNLLGSRRPGRSA